MLYEVITGRHLDVPRLEVAVDHAAVVRRLQRLRDLPRGVERLLQRQGTARQPLGERLPLDQLEDSYNFV